jgi:hypothetical protein
METRITTKIYYDDENNQNCLELAVKGAKEKDYLTDRFTEFVVSVSNIISHITSNAKIDPKSKELDNETKELLLGVQDLLKIPVEFQRFMLNSMGNEEFKTNMNISKEDASKIYLSIHNYLENIAKPVNKILKETDPINDKSRKKYTKELKTLNEGWYITVMNLVENK